MEGAANGVGSQEKMISKKKARLILVGAIIAYILLGIAVGYFFFWDQYSKASRYEQELKDAIKKVQNNPNDLAARVDLGFKFMKAGKYDEAMAEYNAALKIDPNNSVVKMNIGYLYIEMKKYREADKVLQEVLETDPGFQVYFLLGKSKFLQGSYREAIQYLMAARDMNPTDTEVHYLLGQSYEKIGDNDMAIKSYEEALRFDPERKDAQEALARLKK